MFSCFDLVNPKEPRVNAALMHYAIEIVLESKKIDSIPAEIVNVIVIHTRALKLETHCPSNPAVLPIDNHPLIFDVSD
jgi:hypothetical protein